MRLYDILKRKGLDLPLLLLLLLIGLQKAPWKKCFQFHFGEVSNLGVVKTSSYMFLGMPLPLSSSGRLTNTVRHIELVLEGARELIVQTRDGHAVYFHMYLCGFGL